jgi:hypothetical protein
MSKLTTAFLAWVLEAIEDKFTYIAIGSDNTAENASHTALQAEISTNGGARASAVSSIDAGVLTISKEFAITGNLTVNEAGVFNASSNGTMMVRAIANSEITLASGQFLEVVFKITVEEGVA